MTKTTMAALAGAAAMAFACEASAATIYVDQTLTSGPLVGGGGYSPVFGPTMTIGSWTGPVQYFNLGDTLDWTLRFPVGSEVTFNGLFSLGVAFNQVMLGNPTVTATGSVSFLDSSGAVILAGTTHTDSNNVAVADYHTSHPMTGDDVTAAGIHAIIHLDSFSGLATPVTGSYFTQPDIYFISAWSVTIPPGLTPPPGTPEPSTWVLSLLGFGLLGTALRRRRATSALAA
jgi:hypothetical protein